MSDFEIKALRGHFRIAADHLDGAVREFEKLKAEYDRVVKENERLSRQLHTVDAYHQQEPVIIK